MEARDASQVLAARSNTSRPEPVRSNQLESADAEHQGDSAAFAPNEYDQRQGGWYSGDHWPGYPVHQYGEHYAQYAHEVQENGDWYLQEAGEMAGDDDFD